MPHRAPARRAPRPRTCSSGWRAASSTTRWWNRRASRSRARFFPQLEVAFDVGKPVDYAWLVSTVDKKRILEAAKPFFERIRKDGTLKRLVDRYYGHADAHHARSTRCTLLERIRTQLPTLQPYFVEAERASGIDWRLLAAIGYQESHWDAEGHLAHGRARPHDAHRGDRRAACRSRTASTRARASSAARATSRCSRRRSRRASPSPTAPTSRSPPTTWASATSRTRASSRSAPGSTPTSGRTCARCSPQLAEPEHFQTLKHGYARGFEALQLVDNVRNYYDILAAHGAARRARRCRAYRAPEPQLSTKGAASGK